MGKTIGIILAVLIALSCLIWFFGASNPSTPAGYVGYVTQGAIFGKHQFLTLQKGPTSYGRARSSTRAVR